MELLEDLFFVGVVNVVNGMGVEVGQVLVIYDCIVKVVFIGLIEVGKYILKCVVESLIFLIVELGGKLLNIFMDDIFDYEDSYVDKCVEGVLFVFFN